MCAPTMLKLISIDMNSATVTIVRNPESESVASDVDP